MKLDDISGKRFGRILVIRRSPIQSKKPYWVCKCDCGTEKEILGDSLKNRDPRRRTSSCGCLGRERRKESATSHGKSETDELKMFWEARKRARRKGLQFNIRYSDISIPSHCPLLGIPLFKVGVIQTPNSPALDRIDSAQGYIKGNIQVISNQANTMKSNASFDEFELMFHNWKSMREGTK